MIRSVPRREQSRAMVFLSPVIAIGRTVASGLVLFAILGFEPLDPLYNFFIKPLLGRSGLTNLALKATPIILIAIGLAMCYRADVWNIGAEGQYTLGAIASTGLALAFYDVDSFFLLPGMFLAGALGGSGAPNSPTALAR